MRIAATADLHFISPRYSAIQEQLAQVRDQADLLVLAGDLTNYGKPAEMEELLKSLGRSRIPIVAVLGNHDYESGSQAILTRMLTDEGINVLDGTAYERDGVGFAGTKGFCGGFAPYELMPFGEGGIKTFVEIAEREAIKLDYGLEQLKTPVKVAIMHYAPIKDTVMGEPEPIFPFLGSSRLQRALDKHKPSLALHGHAHHGTFAGESKGGVRVHNVALPILRERGEEHPFTLFTF